MSTLIIFWGAVALLAYTLVVFPLVILLRGVLCRRSYRTAEITPHLSIIIAAHNEADSIAARIENLLTLDYPRDRMEIIIASDGSTDGTDKIVEGYSDQGVWLLAFERGGKISALNQAVPEATGEILVFSDANCEFAPDALRALARPFADRKVGGVAGNQVYVRHNTTSLTADGECTYWNFDRLMKQAQSRAGNVSSATGAIYAIRRSLYRAIPLGVTDDFVASTQVIAQGYRLVFASDAISREPVAVNTGTEFGRKVRVITQGFLAIGVMRELLNPLHHGFYAFQLLWHKVLRRLMVLPLTVLAVTSLLLWEAGPFYQAAACAQGMFYMSAFLGLVLRKTKAGSMKFLTMPFYFCMVNTAAFLAMLNAVIGRRIERWEPQRASHEPAEELVLSGTDIERT